MKVVVATRNKKAAALGRKCAVKPQFRVFDSKRVTVKDETGRVIAIFLPKALTARDILTGRNLVRYKNVTSSRGMAAGQNADALKKGIVGFGSGNRVQSSVVGYMENNHLNPCRMTAMTRKHKDFFHTETRRLVKKISTLFSKYAPQHARRQREFIKSINPNMVISGTLFTTATVNVDFRTHTHKDKGDFSNGLGNLAVFNAEGSRGWSGGEFLLPDFNVAFRLQEGDVLFVDVHETHCNAPIIGKGRVSLVLYAREKLATKCQTTSPNVLVTGAMKPGK